MRRPKLTKLDALTLPMKPESHRVASLDALRTNADTSHLKIAPNFRPKPELKLIVNHRPETALKTSFGQMMNQFCDSLDRQIEEILRM
jgi:hypothetical protein